MRSPSSANAAVVMIGPLLPSGRHTPVRASRVTVSTPFDSLPAAWRLSLGMTISALVLGDPIPEARKAARTMVMSRMGSWEGEERA
jgi:hypothetical protein